jgi:hypothetical protein
MEYKYEDNYTPATISLTRPDGTKTCFPEKPGHALYDKMVSLGVTPADYVAPDETWETIRGKRNQLLKDTDWQGMSDVTMSDAQKAYRQKLRDLPATNADPTKIVFPDAP